MDDSQRQANSAALAATRRGRPRGRVHGSLAWWAETLGLATATILKLKAKPDWPGDESDPRVVLDWIKRMGNARLNPRLADPVPPAGAHIAIRLESPAGDATLVALRAARTPAEVAEAAMMAARDRLAAGIEAGSIEVRSFDDLKKVVSELRIAQTQAREEAEATGQLVHRDVARAVGAWTTQLYVRGLERLSSLLVSQVETWAGDPAWRALEAEARGRAVRAWADRQCQELRAAGAAEIEARIEEERSA